MGIDPREYLPHEPPMVMIEGAEDIAEGEAAARAIVSPLGMFFEPRLDGVPSCAALEYMAQTMAFAVGARRRRRQQEPKVGFVLGSRKLEVSIPVFRRDENYRIHVRCEYTDEEFASFDCEITESTGKIVARGRLTAFQPEITDTNPIMKGIQP